MTDLEKFCKQFPDHAEEATERAAIMQFDGGMPKDYAENQAVKLLIKKYDLRRDL